MKLSSLGRSRGAHRYVAAGVAAVAVAGVVLGGVATAASAAADPTAWAAPSRIVLQVGADESQRVVNWYSNNADKDQVVQVAPSYQVWNGQFPPSALTFASVVTKNNAVTNPATKNSKELYNGHAVITGLKQYTQYVYRVGEAGHWSASYTFKTQAFGGNYDFLFFGDPQIGSSGDDVLDGTGWSATLDTALAANPNAELLVSGGDQVENANDETEWDQFFASDKLRQYPWVSTIGNHDVGGAAYNQHFWEPNNTNGTADAAKYYANGTPTSDTSGGDYWFIYKGVLFIDLNSNSYATSTGGGGDAAHIDYVTSVINAQGAKAKYTVLIYHHSIYSPADHANDDDNAQRRLDFTTAFSQLGINLVLQGHDHSYSRSYEIKNGYLASDTKELKGSAWTSQYSD
ncbi:MAG TPA: FN3 domain-containing metallophosphoesterase family protein, partial [Cellulomonas sp.]